MRTKPLKSAATILHDDYWLLCLHPIGGLLVLAGGSEDGAGIILQDTQPRHHVGGVVTAWMMGGLEICQDHAARKLGYDLFEA